MTVTELHNLSPDQAGWTYLGIRVLLLEPGDVVELADDASESAIVLVRGCVDVSGPALSHRLTRSNPFLEMGEVAYLPPRSRATLRAQVASEIAIGTAPADGRYPPRIITPQEMASELRGGGPAYRQITSPLAHPIPAERLIVYEAYLPRGTWSGWPPHRHDGRDGSPYLEETYFFHFDRPSGYGVHRNYATDEGYDQQIVVSDGSLVTVPRGYHVCAAAPAANAWILNFLAGASDDRALPPVFDQAETWITEDWSRGAMQLPAVAANNPVGPGQA